MKDAYYFSHDSNAQQDPKIIRLIMDMKMQGYGIFWSIIEHLRNDSDYKLNLSDCNAIAFTSHCDVKEVEKVVKEFELFEIDANGSFYSTSLLRRMEELEKRRAILSEAGRRGGLASSQAKATLKQASSSKVKESKVKENTHTREFMSYFNEKTKKNLTLTNERKKIIESRLKIHSLEELKVAVDNFANDPWEDRDKFTDVVYCIGVRNKVDNLEKWLNAKTKKEGWSKP